MELSVICLVCIMKNENIFVLHMKALNGKIKYDKDMIKSNL